MQIYKIYINEKELILLRSKHLALQSFEKKPTLVLRFTGKNKVLYQSIDTLEKDGPYERVIIHSEDYKTLKSAFKLLFTTIEAGGGLVLNENGEGLFIFRRGYWDLPKGKVDSGESRKTAAVREVIEETGVTELKQGELLLKTRHVYKTNSGKRVLKLTNWYLMHAPKQELVPETREQIEQALWLDLDHFLKKYHPTFKSVLDVVDAFRQLKEE